MKKSRPFLGGVFFVVALSLMMWSYIDGGESEGSEPEATEDAQWKQITSNTTNKLEDIFVLDASHAWAVGDKGTIICYDGNSWSEPVESDPETSAHLYAVVAFNENDVWALGDEVRVHFDGTKWTTYTKADDPNLKHVVRGATVVPSKSGAVKESNPYLGWACTADGKYYRYKDSEWEYVDVSGQPKNYAVAANSDGEIWSVGDKAKIHSWTPDDGWNECKLSGPFKKAIRGVSVCRNPESQIWNEVLAVGEGNRIFHSPDGYLFDVYDSGENKETLACVVWLDKSHAWAVGNNGAIVFSDEIPIDWEIQDFPDSELRGGLPNLYGIDALDETHAWAVGDNGTLLEYSPSS
jgi:photosystem II stability/assembly factor-like uncharacterized protein